MSRWQRAAVLAPTLAVAALALACGTGSGNDSARNVAELQSGLSVGNPPEWYTQKLDELGYQVASLRYDGSNGLEYRVEKDASQFVVRVSLDAERGTGSRIEIEPTTGASAAAAQGAPSTAPSTSTTASGTTTADRPAAASGADTGVSSGSEAGQAPATRAPASDATTRRPAPAPTPRFVGVPAGTRIAAQLNDYLDSGESQSGDRFTMTVTEAVYVAGIEAIPAGSLVQGLVAEAESARRPNKGGRLVLKAERIDVRGERVPVEAVVTAETRELEGEGSIRQDLKEIAIGAGIGGLVGGLIGGGKGVLAGVLIGAGGTFAATKGEQVELPPDTPLLVELRQEASFPLSR